jgi:hypothetical protein
VTVILTVLLSLVAPVVSGATLSVTNFGTDSNSCGSSANSCRSITRAIENASPGDTIWVGAGHYGNIHGDPAFTAPGDEQPQTFPALLNFSSCMICITKPVHLYSYEGAAVTVIDSGHSPTFTATVMILADGAVFGSAGHGFTVTGGNAIGVLVDLENWETSVTGVTVSGNVDVRDRTGFSVFGPFYDPFRNCPGPQFCPPFRGQILLLGNQSIDNETSGFGVQPNTADALGQPLRFVIQNNVAVGAATGFTVFPGFGECDDCADQDHADDVATLHNIAADGGVGFSLFRSGLVKENIAIHNSQYGFLMVEGGPFSWNSAIGNSGPGVIAAVEAPYAPKLPPPVSFTAFTNNNFFGNDRNRPTLSLGGYGPPWSDYRLGSSAQCGVLNIGAIWQNFSPVTPHPPPAPPVPAVMLQATQSYWGSASGPAANGSGSGDAACDQNDAITNSKPFVTAPVAITPP